MSSLKPMKNISSLILKCKKKKIFNVTFIFEENYFREQKKKRKIEKKEMKYFFAE